jgi:hypothetical protein
MKAIKFIDSRMMPRSTGKCGNQLIADHGVHIWTRFRTLSHAVQTAMHPDGVRHLL